MIKIQNSVDKKKYELKDSKITIYNCGPTVYNHVHLGNVRPLITFDVLYRYLEFLKKDILFMHNITDIDDKIINVAKANNISEQEVSEKYTNSYLELFKILNVKKMKMPKVSLHIQDILNYVQKLIDKGFAYISNGDVYFSVDKIKNYGHISHIDINSLLDGVRKQNKTNKKSPLDFVLWKQTNEGLNWKNPWGQDGRPGWHTECCVMINKYAGDHVTIHGGGVDLKFPHHENENAQNYALFSRDIADYWMHIGHVNIDGQKMSKSLNNFILVKDFINKENANGLRWFFYQTKYQNPINFTKELFNECVKGVNYIIYVLNVCKTWLIAYDSLKDVTMMPSEEFFNALDDDLNFPNAITEIKLQIKQINTLTRQKKWLELNNLFNCVKNELYLLGIKINDLHDDVVIETIKQWKNKMDEKDWQSSDMLRKELINKKVL